MNTNENAEILSLMRVAMEKSRGYASYWEWKLDKRQPELHAAQVLARFLFPDMEHSLSSIVNDPPDAVIKLGGRRYGIEVTEIVDRQTVERAARAKSLGFSVEYDWGDWNRDRLFLALSNGILAKDQKLAKAAHHYEELLLAFVTDEPMIYPELVTSVLRTLRIETQNIDRAFVILSYHPAADPSMFPDRCPIFEIPINH
jgi:hypothetical protein